MSRKKAKAAQDSKEETQTKRGRPKGANRAKVVLNVVATDSTFCPAFSRPQSAVNGYVSRQQVGWVGKCIHCNTHAYVALDGQTELTLEHIRPLCDGGDPTDPRNLALACKGCNNRKGIDHDQHVGKGGRADEVIQALQAKRLSRWREPVQVPARV